MLGFISKLFGGNKSEKDVKLIAPIVQKINEFYKQYNNLNNDELRAKTAEFKLRIKKHLETIDDAITAQQKQADELPSTEIGNREAIYQLIDKLKKDRNEQIEVVLKNILPEAFAVVKETSRRFKENTTLTSTATELDKELALLKQNVTIEGSQSIYTNSWLAAGVPIQWNMLHYDVQLIGGVVLHEGKISEMATGEGKTLVSTLPAYLNALAGEGMHIVTVNDYLSRRDSEWNGPIFEWLGLRVDCIDKHEPNSEARRKAYNADITYGTNNEFGFDYLRDNMIHNPEEMVQRKHHYAMVDEVDSVLIDDARTPLIISGPVGANDHAELFLELKPRIEKLVNAQRDVVNMNLIAAKKMIADGNDDNKEGGGLALMKAHRGLPKNSALIKFLNEPGIKSKLQKSENYFIADQQKEMAKVDADLYFYIEEKNNSVDLTEKGLQLITKTGEDADFFVLPDISLKSDAIEKMLVSDEEKLKLKESLINEYISKSDRIHTIQQLLKAYTLFEKDSEYVVMENKVLIVDEQTGRIMDGRRYSDGLHQAIEAKENANIEATTQTYATITLQNFFRMYHKLAGMTGTAETEAAEFYSIYKLDVVTIPTNITAVRKDEQDKVFKTKREKFKAVIDEVEKLSASGRPSLIGTTTVEISELLSKMLQQRKIAHNVLNAKQHSKEAQIVADAGLPGAVTIATNMAGRGTDIKLGAGVKEAGGLAILGTERHESRRVDRQLRGRAGRQGDPGSSQFYVALDDDLMRVFGSDRIAGLMDRMGYKEGEVIQHSMLTNSIERAQKKVEENNFGIRKRLLEYDDVMNKQRQVIYGRRNHALLGERLALDLDNAFYSVATNLVSDFKASNNFETFRLDTIKYFAIDTPYNKEQLSKGDTNTLILDLYKIAKEKYTNKSENIANQMYPFIQNVRKEQGNHIENVIVPFSDGRKDIQALVNVNKAIETGKLEIIQSLEKSITLAFIDDAWKEHLRAMDDLRHSVQTAGYEQKDPLVIYKLEAFSAFKAMDEAVNKDIVSFLTHSDVEGNQNNLQEGRHQKTDLSKLSQQKTDFDNAGEPAGYDTREVEEEVKQKPIVREEPKIGRNEPCFCGSGKKYKTCHGK